jgi:hypothetical protein
MGIARHRPTLAKRGPRSDIVKGMKPPRLALNARLASRPNRGKSATGKKIGRLSAAYSTLLDG